MPGVVNVVTAKDVKGTNRLVAPQGTVHSLCDGLDRPVICDGVVRRYGDVVAIVAATGRDKARAAAERVRVEYEPLPAVMTFMEAAAEGAFPIHENTPNIYMEQPVYKGEDTQGLLEHAAHTVEGSFGTSRPAASDGGAGCRSGLPAGRGRGHPVQGAIPVRQHRPDGPGYWAAQGKGADHRQSGGRQLRLQHVAGQYRTGGGLRAGAGCAGFPRAQLRRTPAHDGQAFPRVRQCPPRVRRSGKADGNGFPCRDRITAHTAKWRGR